MSKIEKHLRALMRRFLFSKGSTYEMFLDTPDMLTKKWDARSNTIGFRKMGLKI